MKVVLILAVSCIGFTLSFAQDDNMATWKLNEAKSKLSSRAPKNTTVIYEAAGDNVKVTVDGSTLMVSRSITNGLASLTAKTIPSSATQMKSRDHIQRLTTIRWA